MVKQWLLEWLLKQSAKKKHVSEDYQVKSYLEKIPQYFDPSKVEPGRDLTIVYEFHDSGKNDGVWTVTVSDGTCRLTEGEAEHYDTKMYMTAETYRRLMTGQLELARLAYSTGAVRFYGNSLGHRELNYYLKFPKDSAIVVL